MKRLRGLRTRGLWVGTVHKRKSRGGPQLSLSDMIFSSTFKVYSSVSGRRFATDLREAKQRGCAIVEDGENLEDRGWSIGGEACRITTVCFVISKAKR